MFEIDISKSYWDVESFNKSIEELRKLIIEFMTNIDKSYDGNVRQIGNVLTFIELIKDHTLIDNRGKGKGKR